MLGSHYNRILVQLSCFTILILSLQSDVTGQVYECKRAASAITVDGKLDDAAWGEANWTKFRESKTGVDVKTPGQFALLWDAEYLYVAYDLKDKNLLASIYFRDERVWVQDVAEIFIDPKGLLYAYYEFQFNPIANMRDILILHSGRGSEINALGEFNTGIILKTTIDGTLENNQDVDTGWKAEVAIPFSDLWLAPNVPPKAGDRWKFNVYRIDYGLESPEFQAWHPVLAESFHTPWKFGTLLFK